MAPQDPVRSARKYIEHWDSVNQISGSKTVYFCPSSLSRIKLDTLVSGKDTIILVNPGTIPVKVSTEVSGTSLIAFTIAILTLVIAIRRSRK